jgi:predicted DsbA family dithiol-disulfide isomerase
MADEVTARGVVEWAEGLQQQNEHMRTVLHELLQHAKPVGDHTTLADLRDTIVVPRALFQALSGASSAAITTASGELVELPARLGRKRKSTS